MEKGGKGSLTELSVQENGLTLSAIVQIALTGGPYSTKGTAKKPALPWHTANARRNHIGAKRRRVSGASERQRDFRRKLKQRRCRPGTKWRPHSPSGETGEAGGG